MTLGLAPLAMSVLVAGLVLVGSAPLATTVGILRDGIFPPKVETGRRDFVNPATW